MKTIIITKEHLDAAEALNRANPCCGTDAKNAAGQDTSPLAEDACQFCATGAIIHVLGADPFQQKRLDSGEVFWKHDEAFQLVKGREGLHLTNPECIDRAWVTAREMLTGVEVRVPE